MAASSGNSPDKGSRLGRAGALVLAVALVAAWWLTGLDKREMTVRDNGPPSPRENGPSDTRVKKEAPPGRPIETATPKPTPEELTERHGTVPDEEEWTRLLRLLQEKLPDPPADEDRERLEAVMARFSAHAGARQVDDLALVYRNASTMEAGQRALEVLGTLQDGAFQVRAREIIADDTLPADDQVVTALARSLVATGTPADLVMVLDRIDSGKARDHTEYSGMDGLMSAVQQAMAPEMEDALCDALANKSGTRTWMARYAVAAALQNHSTSRSTLELAQAASRDPDTRVAEQARESLEILRETEK